MSPRTAVRLSSVPPPVLDRGILAWICTKNPFYALSAALFLVGLRLSFDTQDDAGTWVLMSALAGYTLLLAVTACLLVRLAAVWDDVRTLLLLVVLMFLATSVTFDEVLVLEPGRGVLLYLGGLLFAIVVSEGLLRGTRLALPALFRVPYYLLLALFFLYPLALSPLVGDPHGEPLLWGLFGFSTAAGVVFLTLLPAIRRGPFYVADNGSPWRWPLYPWMLFGVLAFAVPARAFLLCWSMHLLEGPYQGGLIFGPYFLVPFGLALAVLLLEIGLVSFRAEVMRLALVLPAGLVALATIGHQEDSVYREFLGVFCRRLGGDPLALALLLASGFYAYAALRRVRWATEGLTAALVALALVGRESLDQGQPDTPWLAPLELAVVLQLVLGFGWRSAGRCLLGIGGLAAVVTLALPGLLGEAAAVHVVLLGLLVLGAVFNDPLGRSLRAVADALVVTACLATLAGTLAAGRGVLPWWLSLYPLLLGAVILGYGLVLRHRLSQITARFALACALVSAVSQGYRPLRESRPGLDHIAASLGLFGMAVLISLAKAGVLWRWMRMMLGMPELPRTVRMLPEGGVPLADVVEPGAASETPTSFHEGYDSPDVE
jgi:hypothetical protein